MGPFSGLMFLVGAAMIFFGKNRNNDDLFRWDFRDSPGNDGEFNRQKMFFLGIVLVVIAVIMWIYLLVNGGEANSDMSEALSAAGFFGISLAQ